MQGGSMHRRDDVSGTWSFEVVDWARGDPRVSVPPTPLIRLRHAASASQRRGVITSNSCCHTLAQRLRFAADFAARSATLAHVRRTAPIRGCSKVATR